MKETRISDEKFILTLVVICVMWGRETDNKLTSKSVSQPQEEQEQ